MAKKNWYEDIDNRMPVERDYDFNFWPALGRSLAKSFFDNARLAPRGEVGAMPLTDLMAELDGIGFQDRKDHYELVTELVGNGDIKEDAVKIELLHESEDAGAYVKVTYEHKTETENSHYSHSQTTCVTLPKDADEETVSAHFDEKNRVVVTVNKKEEPKKNGCRTIPIKGV